MDTILFLEIDTAIAIAILLFASTTVIRQGTVGVTTLFGRYRRILRPGLHFRIPFLEPIFTRLSLQHRSAELEFQAITEDQASVDFKALIIYAVHNEAEETIKRAAFKFVDERSFMQALIRNIEGAIRSFVATKRQNQILGLRREIVDEVNANIEHEINDWGFHLINLQINDIAFDEAIMRSMAQVAATHNMRAAAENEAQAQYVAKTRIAEAEAHARRALAEAERDADRLRGEGNALLRQQIAQGLVEAEKLLAAAGVDSSLLQFAEWLESMKEIAARGRGNTMAFDGSMEAFERARRRSATLTEPVANEASSGASALGR